MLPDNTEPRSQMDAIELGPNPAPNPVSIPAPRPVWQVRLLGAVQADRAGLCLSHWPSRAVAALLARLALSPNRAHPREELVELLWPGVALDVGRNRLRQTLSTLKSMLEPVELSAPVLQADRMSVRVVPGQLLSDAREFEQLLRAGKAAQAHRLYLGDFMPGFYEDWVLSERARLSHLFDRVDALPLLQSEPPMAHAEPEPQDSALGQLPHHWTRLYGTEQSAIRLRELCLRQRLVTVFGPGGSGKTRLTVHVARGLKKPVGKSAGQPDSDIGFERVIFVSMIDCTGRCRN